MARPWRRFPIQGLTVKLNGTEIPGAWKFTGETVPTVGEHQATAAFTPQTGAGNYLPLTKAITYTITQKVHPDENAAGSAKYGMSGTVDLHNLIVPGGTATYMSNEGGDGVLLRDPSIAQDGTTLKFEFKNEIANAGEKCNR